MYIAGAQIRHVAAAALLWLDEPGLGQMGARLDRETGQDVSLVMEAWGERMPESTGFRSDCPGVVGALEEAQPLGGHQAARDARSFAAMSLAL